jgi:hypothetical protein
MRQKNEGQKDEHFGTLSAAQNRVIAECRRLAGHSRPHQRHTSEEVDRGVKALQDTIDAIDRLLSGKPDSAGGKLFFFPTRAWHQPPTSMATAGNPAGQQVPLAESVEVYSDPRGIGLHFRPSGTQADLPIVLTRRTAQDLLERLTVLLAGRRTAPPRIRP